MVGKHQRRFDRVKRSQSEDHIHVHVATAIHLNSQLISVVVIKLMSLSGIDKSLKRASLNGIFHDI